MKQGSSPWTNFMKKHQRSYTCQNDDFESVYDRLQKMSIQTDQRYLRSTKQSQQQPNSSSTITSAKQSINASKKYPINNQIRSSVGSNYGIRENSTSRHNKSQIRQKTPRDVSRDLQKVQRIIQIDHDIMKSQINNLNSQYRNKKNSLESQNKILNDKIKKLESIVIEDKKQIIKFKNMMEEMFDYIKDKFQKQTDINNTHSKQINEIKGNTRIANINNRAHHALERSNSKKSHNSFIKKQQPVDVNLEQKYIQRIKLLEFELSLKDKQLKEEKEKNQIKNHFEMGDNSLTFDIQKNTKSNSQFYECSFSKNDKSIESIMLCCQQLSSMSHKLLMSTVTDPSVLQGLDRKLQDSLYTMKDLIGGNRQFSMLSMKQAQDLDGFTINQ